MKIKQAQNTYRFIQLVMYSTIPIPKSGATAVYNDEHACDHYFEQNVGSWTLCSQIPSKVTGKSAGLTMVFWRFWLRCEAAGRASLGMGACAPALALAKGRSKGSS